MTVSDLEILNTPKLAATSIQFERNDSWLYSGVINHEAKSLKDVIFLPENNQNGFQTISNISKCHQFVFFKSSDNSNDLQGEVYELSDDDESIQMLVSLKYDLDGDELTEMDCIWDNNIELRK